MNQTANQTRWTITVWPHSMLNKSLPYPIHQVQEK